MSNEADSGGLDPAVRAAFMSAVDRVYKGVDPSTVRVELDPAFAVTGFVSLEVVAEVPLRGWANRDVGVIARLHDFGPVLDAMHLCDDDLSPDAEGLAARFSWLHGPPYVPVAYLAAGELGASEAFDLTPRRERRAADGAVVFTFALRDPGGDGEPECVIRYTMIGYGEDAYKIRLEQVAPEAG